MPILSNVKIGYIIQIVGNERTNDDPEVYAGSDEIVFEGEVLNYLNKKC